MIIIMMMIVIIIVENYYCAVITTWQMTGIAALPFISNLSMPQFVGHSPAYFPENLVENHLLN